MQQTNTRQNDALKEHNGHSYAKQKLLRSRWGGRHPATADVMQSDTISKEQPDSIEDHKTYFDEFRERVLKIKETGHPYIDGETKRTPVATNSYDKTSSRHETHSNEPYSNETSGDASVLTKKLTRQNARLEELELLVRELKFQHSQTLIHHQHEVSQLRVELKKAQKASFSEYGKYSRFPAVQEAEINELREENAVLQERNREITKRAKVLVSIHKHRLDSLEAKLQSSLSVNQYYLNNRGNYDYADDSTTQLLYAYQDNTTAQLLQGTEPRVLTGRAKLRSCIFAVIFAVRIRRRAQEEKVWRMELLD